MRCRHFRDFCRLVCSLEHLNGGSRMARTGRYCLRRSFHFPSTVRRSFIRFRRPCSRSPRSTRRRKSRQVCGGCSSALVRPKRRALSLTTRMLDALLTKSSRPSRARAPADLTDFNVAGIFPADSSVYSLLQGTKEQPGERGPGKSFGNTAEHLPQLCCRFDRVP